MIVICEGIVGCCEALNVMRGASVGRAAGGGGVHQ